jgi:RNA polymerase sigma-70 factor (ECF subfamily)
MVDSLTIAVRDSLVTPSAKDNARLERMFTAHHATVWRVLRRRGLSADAAADATQETFLIAAERLNDIQSNNERAFLIGTALRVAHTLSRKTVRWKLDHQMDKRLSRTRDAADTRADIELCDLALTMVNAELVEVFVLYEIEGMSSPEIAALLEIPLGSVASRLRRAREQFRTAVARIERTMLLEEKS